MPMIDQIRAEKLIQLAHERFDPKVKRAELKVLRDSASSEDLPEPDDKAPRPEIRPEFVRWLATDPEAAPHIDPKGLRVYAATIPGRLDLRNCHVNLTLDFHRCVFQGWINLLSAETRGLYFFDSSLAKGIRAAGVIVHGPLFLKRIQSDGEISLLGTEIEGDLDCSEAKLTAKGDALSADGAQIGGNVFIRGGFESEGEIRLVGAEITGNLECDGAKLKAKGKALSVDGAQIGGNVFIRGGFESEGEIRLLGAKITGQLVCAGAKLKAQGNALNADRAKIGGSFFLDNGFESEGEIRLIGAEIGGDLSIVSAKVGVVTCKNMVVTGDLYWQSIGKSEETALSLVGAKVKNLRDDRMSWPEEGNLDIDGLAYEELTLHERLSDEDVKAHQYAGELPLLAKERIDWIMLQPEECLTEPQPWMQLRELLEKKGDRKGAKYVLFRFRCLQAQKSWAVWRWLRKGFAWLEENPLRIGWFILLTLLFGTSIFTWGNSQKAMTQTVRLQPNMVLSEDEAKKTKEQNPAFEKQPGEENKPVSVHYPPFQPFVYTLENAVPLIKLGMDEKWAPDPRPEFCRAWFPRLHWLYFVSTYGFLSFSRWALIVGGWIQATILAASVVERFRK